MRSAEDLLFQRFGRTYPKGTVLFREGEKGEEMFVIQGGKVQISMKVRGVEKILSVLQPGEFFGEMAILNSKPRSATAVVAEDAKLLVIDSKTFEAMVRGNAEISLRMIKKLAARLQEADDQIENLLLKDHNSKVVHALVRLSETQGTPVERGTFVRILPEELGQKVGLPVDRVNEVVAKLAKAKIVAATKDGLLVHDGIRLKKFLEFLEMKEQFGDIV
jgi:CRP/FNR family transcriptional regulator, cyclic AMP receptor protein